MKYDAAKMLCRYAPICYYPVAMTSTSEHRLLTILGPTASGKTRLAVTLAREYGGEIISADSRQVFRGMDIGSGKDLHEYGEIPHHLIDIIPAGSEFSLFEFRRHFLRARADIARRGKLPVLCGGTGLYLDAVLRNYRMVEVPVDEALRSECALQSDAELAAELMRLRPEQHNSTDLLQRERTIRAIEIALGENRAATVSDPAPELQHTVIGIHRDRAQLRELITARLRERLAAGMIEEVQQLHDGGIPWSRLDYYGLEYRFIGAYLRGELNRNDMFQRLNSAIHDFAKRQGNWFRRMERHGIPINWVDGGGDTAAQARSILHNRGYRRINI